MNNKVLDISHGEIESEATVIMHSAKRKSQDNQLWYEGPGGVLRSKLHEDYALDSSGNRQSVKHVSTK